MDSSTSSVDKRVVIIGMVTQVIATLVADIHQAAESSAAAQHTTSPNIPSTTPNITQSPSLKRLESQAVHLERQPDVLQDGLNRNASAPQALICTWR